MHVWYTCTWPAYIFVIALSNHQSCLLHLQQTRKGSNGCLNCTGQAGLYQQAVKMVKNICSMQIPYSEIVFFVVTFHSVSIFLINFSHPSSWLFSAHWFKKGLYFDQTLCHKVISDVVHSVYPAIYHFIFWRNVCEKWEFLWD